MLVLRIQKKLDESNGNCKSTATRKPHYDHSDKKTEFPRHDWHQSQQVSIQRHGLSYETGSAKLQIDYVKWYSLFYFSVKFDKIHIAVSFVNKWSILTLFCLSKLYIKEKQVFKYSFFFSGLIIKSYKRKKKILH